MKVGCNTVLFRETDVFTAMEHIAWAGYDAVEFAAIPGMVDHLASDDPEHLRRVKARAAELGLTPVAIEAATNDRARLNHVMRQALELGVPIVNIGPGGKSGDEQSFRHAIAVLRELARDAEALGVKLGLKPHVGNAVYNTDTALRAMAEIGSPAVGLNFDPSHLYRAEENPEESARRMGRYIIISHFRDCLSRERQVGPPETQVPGRGAINIPAVLRALKDVGYDYALDLEIIGAKEYSREQCCVIAAESRGHMQACLQACGAR
ncbi:MAG: sugar phosphate isomerase/epimerase [Chloroflexota bacterium]